VVSYCTSATDFCANKRAVQDAIGTFLELPERASMSVASTQL
jgi:hypothetical protein